MNILKRFDKIKPEEIGGLMWYFLLLKRFFDAGWGMTGYIKYVIALFGISSLNVGRTIIFGMIYGVSCLVVGYIWYAYKFFEVDTEIGNRFNWFMEEMREMKKVVESRKHEV